MKDFINICIILSCLIGIKVQGAILFFEFGGRIADGLLRIDIVQLTNFEFVMHIFKSL